MRRKIIFIDVDGPLAWGTWGDGRINIDEGSEAFTIPYPWVEEDCQALQKICDETNAELVVSSDWKLFATLEELQEMFTKYGVIKQPIDTTPNIPLKYDKNYYTAEELAEYRVSEVNMWLKEHPEVTQWVAVDDLPLGETFGPISGNSNGGLSNFVLTPRSYEGIKQSGIKEKILNFLL
jgi:hypothetical protein